MTDNFISRRWRAASTTLLCAAAACMPTTPLAAGDGHDHGAEPAAAGAASPRVEAHSDLFELVGVVDKGEMTLYLDRYATNEPVVGAKIEFEAGAVKGVAQPRPDGTYLAKFDALSKPGQVALSFVVTAGADTDILAGELALGEPHVDHEEAARPWARWASYAALALAALLLAAALLRKRAEARRNFQ